MKKNGTVFCIEGTNSRIKKLISRFNEEQTKQLYQLCEIAEKMLEVNLMEYLQSEVEDRPVEISIRNLVLTYISDYIIFNTYLSHGIKPDVLVGYSLGLNTAMVCAGNLSFEGGLEILQSVKKCLRYADENLHRNMALVVGLTRSQIEAYIEQHHWQEYVSIASINSEYSFLITGEEEYVQNVIDFAQEDGALKAVMIHTYMAFHYDKREDWLEECIKGMDQLEVFDRKFDVMSVYSLDLLEDSEEVVKDELKKNVYCQMHWGDALAKLEAEGYHEFWDVSLDGNLKKLSFLTDKKSTFHTFKSLKRME